MVAPAPAVRKQHLWKKGVSGNPAGRRKGSRNITCRVLDRIGEEGAKDVLGVVLTMARTGDMRACEIILSRVWPQRKGCPIVLPDVPAPRDAAGVVETLAGITDAVLRGEVTAEEAAALTAVIETQRRAIDTLDLEQRVTALEQRNTIAGKR